MHGMELAGLDLNLLVALDALLHEAHVGRAAERIGLSQPAVSHALARLRDLFQDPLLVRTGGRMLRTPRAEALRGLVTAAMQQLRDVFQPDREFDPAASTRRFVLRVPDHVVDLLLPPLMRRLARRAPGVTLDAGSWRGPAALASEAAEAVDFIICCEAGPVPGFASRRLFSDTEATVARRGHPRIRELGTLEGFLEAPQIAVRGPLAMEDPVDAWLRAEGHTRQIALTVPSYLQAVHLAAATDLVALVPRRLIDRMAKWLPVRACRPPLDPGLYHEYLLQPRRSAADGGARWMREEILSVGAGLERSGKSAG